MSFKIFIECRSPLEGYWRYVCGNLDILSMVINPRQKVGTVVCLLVENWKIKSRKLVSWNKDIFISEIKMYAQTRQNKEFKDCFPLAPLGWKVCVIVTWKDKPQPQMSLLLYTFPEFLLLSMVSYDINYPFGQFGLAALAVFPSSFLCTPRLLAAGSKQ